ncbi:tRNA lysidine(34) synthetase TilS [Erwinia sp. 9145]|uniref:tRNA lysidine(34) synthetase TilS n=1 Tax=Erwinia sp. 9145 TaxID=1500895 RepID=UPI000555084D|nr:tRNA lysidine(34) synthetase TilS [Erwinia sp. 9145]
MSALLTLEHHLAGRQQLLVAYSGGLDSSVLLHQLVLLREQRPSLKLRAIHIHHGLSAYADRWVKHCQRQCDAWQVPLDVVRVTIDAKNHGVEAAARAARYAAFAQHRAENECLLTAQHLDDQCETLLLALKRGSGPAGLSAMPHAARHHLRPLLSCSRDALASWAAAHHLTWIEDDSNQDRRFDRNFLRREIVPQLSARWPHFAQAAARSAELCAEQEQLLNELLAETLSELVNDEGALWFRPLEKMSEAKRAALLRRWIAGQQGLMPSRDAIRRIWQEVACSREDAVPRLVCGSAEVRRFRDRLYWLPVTLSIADTVIDWSPPFAPLMLPDGLGRLSMGEGETRVRTPAENESVSVRFRAQGQFHLSGRAGSRPLKKIWQALGVPPWQRERTPLIFYNENLISAVGVFVTREGEAAASPCWQLAWSKNS